MPYIPAPRRGELAPKTLAELATADLKPGEFNYIISFLVWSQFHKAPSYALGSMLLTELECAKLEFYRRKLAPYEDRAIVRNGDLDVP